MTLAPLELPLFLHVASDAADRVDPQAVRRIGGIAADGLERRGRGDLKARVPDLVTAEDEPSAFRDALVDERLELLKGHIVAPAGHELAQVAEEGVVTCVVAAHPGREEHLAARIGEALRPDAQELAEDPVGSDDLPPDVLEGHVLESVVPRKGVVPRAGMGHRVVADLMAVLDRSPPAVEALLDAVGIDVKR